MMCVYVSSQSVSPCSFAQTTGGKLFNMKVITPCPKHVVFVLGAISLCGSRAILC